MNNKEKIMICPYCGKEMREGFVQGARGVIFSEERKSICILPSKAMKDIDITGFWKTAAPANYCDDCRILLAKVEEKKKTKK
jgi:hypothetical protein